MPSVRFLSTLQASQNHGSDLEERVGHKDSLVFIHYLIMGTYSFGTWPPLLVLAGCSVLRSDCSAPGPVPVTSALNGVGIGISLQRSWS